MSENDKSYARQLELANLLTRPAIEQAIAALRLPIQSRGLDAGCGIGLHTNLLAEVTGKGGHVTGLDTSAAHLERARKATPPKGAGEVEFVEGDVFSMPFEPDSFDWAWCCDTLYPVSGRDPQAGLAEIKRVVKPGGVVAVVFWSSQKFLPGHPLLEARLDLAHTVNNPYMGNIEPSLHFLRSLGWFKAAGLESPAVQTFAAGASAPLEKEIRRAVGFCFSMLWGDLQTSLARDHWKEYQRLCKPDSPDYILDEPDYCCIVTYSLFTGRVP